MKKTLVDILGAKHEEENESFSIHLNLQMLILAH